MQVLPALNNNEYCFVAVSQNLLYIITNTEEIDFEDFRPSDLALSKYDFSSIEVSFNLYLYQLAIKVIGSTTNIVLTSPFVYHIHALINEFSTATTPYFNFSLEQIQFYQNQFRFLTFDIPYADVESVYEQHKCIIHHFGKEMTICYLNGKLIHNLICCKKLEKLMLAAKMHEAVCKNDCEEVVVSASDGQENAVYARQQEVQQKKQFTDTFSLAQNDRPNYFLTREDMNVFLKTFAPQGYLVVRKRSTKPPSPYVETYVYQSYGFQIAESIFMVKSSAMKTFQAIKSMTWTTYLLNDGVPYLATFAPTDPLFSQLNQVNYMCTQNGLSIEGFSVLSMYCEDSSSLKVIFMHKTAKRLFKMYEALRDGETRIKVRSVAEWVAYDEKVELSRLKAKFLSEG